jgi:hypothetical protein
MLVGIPNDYTHARQRSDLFGSALGITSGNEYATVGILAMDAPYTGANILVGGRGDSTSIQDHYLRRVSITCPNEA